ncbi:MAG: glycosyltransferase family 2 protein [Bacteroidota bacterium]|nr:glycosyltransferase family 2 protein [Bacteroidota bacterium]
MPKLSIITINLNNAAGLQRTMESVFEQTFTDYEYIIIDGGSTDGSKELIEEHQNKLGYWVSEKDGGIFNAQNKGILKSDGKYLLFLNSGDNFYDENILKYVNSFLDSTGIVYGDILVKEPDKSWVKKYNEQISFDYFTKDTLPHQASFIKKSLFKMIGLYDETLQISSDWKFFLEAICKYNVTSKYLDKVIVEYDYSGISSTPGNWEIIAQERQTIINNEWQYFQNLQKELEASKKELTLVTQKYNLLSNSRVVKAYFKIKRFFFTR